MNYCNCNHPPHAPTNLKKENLKACSYLHYVKTTIFDTGKIFLVFSDLRFISVKSKQLRLFCLTILNILSVGKLYTQSSNDKYTWNNFTELRAPLLANRAVLLDFGEVHEMIRQNGEDLVCQIYIHPGNYLPSLANDHFIYQKDFPLREMINHYIYKITQSGIHDKFIRKYFPPLPQDCQSPLKEVDLTDTIFNFVALATGLFVAVLILGFELSFRYFACRS